MKIGGLAKIYTGGYSNLDGMSCVILRVADIGTFCDRLYEVLAADGEFRWYKATALRVLREV